MGGLMRYSMSDKLGNDVKPLTLDEWFKEQIQQQQQQQNQQKYIIREI